MHNYARCRSRPLGPSRCHLFVVFRITPVSVRLPIVLHLAVDLRDYCLVLLSIISRLSRSLYHWFVPRGYDPSVLDNSPCLHTAVFSTFVHVAPFRLCTCRPRPWDRSAAYVWLLLIRSGHADCVPEFRSSLPLSVLHSLFSVPRQH